MNQFDPSPLVKKTIAKLKKLPLDKLKKAGIWRDRSHYYLNIAYPSLQAMNTISPEIVYSKDVKGMQMRVALYIHIPFCTAECFYCHYYKRFNRPLSEVDNYLDAVEWELNMHKQYFKKIEAASIYIGGGTPSYMSSHQIDRLFRMVKKAIYVPKGIEISFEVHPESGTKDRLKVLYSHGVNRLNMGVESFDDTLLARENRRHSSTQAIRVYKLMRQIGFKNINIDLIYGLKDSTPKLWEKNLDEIAILRPSSITAYYLRLKIGTPAYNIWKEHQEQFPSDEELLIMHVMTFERMKELGYVQNPVDWFINDQKIFHVYQDHNWRKTDEIPLLGIGASAYSYINGVQYYNINDTIKYQKFLSNGKYPIWKGERLKGKERMRRTIMLGIKIGIDRPAFKKTYGEDVVKAFLPIWRKLCNLGLIKITHKKIGLTYMGKLFADEVGQQFYSQPMKKRMDAVDKSLISTTWPQFNPT